MLRFNELRITPDGKQLIIEAEVEPEFPGIIIDSVFIDTQDTYNPSKPEGKFGKFKPSENKRFFRIVLDTEEIGINFSETMFFVYVIAGNVPDTPCAKEKSIIMGTVVDLMPLYRRAINGLKELNKECSIPKEFINNILIFKSLELSIKTGNYTLAINIWNNIKEKGLTPSYNYCYCYGNN